MSETNELANKLARRQALNEDEDAPRRQLQVFNPYTEFKEFTRKQIKDFEKMFKKWVLIHFTKILFTKKKSYDKDWPLLAQWGLVTVLFSHSVPSYP